MDISWYGVKSVNEILNIIGVIDEERYHSELQTVERLLIVMTKLDMENGNLEKLTKSDFKSVLQDFFKHSEDNAELDTLMNAAEAEVDTKETGEMEYKNLFMVDDEGKAGPFMDEVKILLRKGRQSYFESIKSQLSDTSSVEVDDLKRAFTMADPEIDAVTLDRYLVWCFNMDIEALKEAEPIELPRLLERLHNGNIMRMAQMNDALLS